MSHNDLWKKANEDAFRVFGEAVYDSGWCNIINEEHFSQMIEAQQERCQLCIELCDTQIATEPEPAVFGCGHKLAAYYMMLHDKIRALPENVNEIPVLNKIAEAMAQQCTDIRVFIWAILKGLDCMELTPEQFTNTEAGFEMDQNVMPMLFNLCSPTNEKRKLH